MTTARDIMSKKVITIESDVPASDIAKLMDKNKVSSIIVTKDSKPYGIISERDMVSKVVAQNKRPAEIKTTDLMSHPLLIVSPLTPAEEVAEKMIQNKVRRIVVSDDKQALGIITVTDFVKHLHALLVSEEEYNKGLYQDMIEDWEYWAS
ncbi:MAG TPA: CBS domain-containing protein [Candidatus Nitrosotalea sp.]|nr:CBS domain-containing protein [Candidatus Nitrosotalea sp.]